ncbi:PREDICTED: serine/threonine-protein kinase mTOR-like [Acropora digitifera]|uniref:serine/threonine-protein kinase mTOR-like n=1 Tax=Acropora digitifera TaxID=70779 RepID=UPI00077A83E2|nr:PREDICTED: serine/threonine-protein kinase mTOR-like [Acropora digitifera]
MQQRLNGLKSRSDESRLQAAKDLQHYVSTELREASAEQYTSFMDELNHHIFEMVSSSDANEKKGGIMAIVALIGIDGGNTTKMSRFANYLRNLLPSNDQVVMQMASKAMGRLALTGGTFTADYVEFEVKRALEWLCGDRNEGRRHAAVLVLKELALNAPTFFFQQVQPFFENIPNAVRDPKQAIREGAVEALQACLVILAQRETKEMQKRPIWYNQIYDEAKRGFEDTNTKEKGVVLTKDDKAHGSMLIMNELIRSASIEGERAKQELEEIYCDQTQSQVSLDDLGITSPKSKFALQTGYQHQRSLALLGGGGMGETMCHSKVCKEFMDSRFEEVCNLVLRYKNTRNSSIQQMLLTILPRLAAFQPRRFVMKYLKDTMEYLCSALKRERERSSAFKATGLIALAVGHDIERHRTPVFEQVKGLFPMKDLGHRRQKAVTVDPMVFACVAMMSRAIGPKISKEVKDLLEPMLSVGLSPALTACLHDLARQVPQLKKNIEDGLLTMLSMILMQKPPRHPGAPRGSAPTLSQSASSHALSDSLDVTSTVLALRTLGTFDFEGHLLAHGNLVRHCADTFLASEFKDIRMEAVRTCSRLLSPSLHPMVVPNAGIHHAAISVSSTQVVSEVLSKMLMVGITDPGGPSLEFEIRELAICTIGRLSSLNPAYIMPSLRKTLIQILTELEYSGVGRNKEQSARMLGHLVSNAPRLIRPYMEPILKALIPKLRDQDPNVVISVLAAIGEHAQVSGTEMSKWLNELCPIILDMLQDASLIAKREIALWTLGQLVESTGYVVEPYRKYPNLLEVLLNFLKTEQAPGIRREAIRVLGLLGALDPYRHKLNQTGGMLVDGDSAAISKDITDSEAADTNTSEMLVTMGSIQLEEFYPAVAVSALMRIVRDPSLSNHHTMVIQAVTFIFKSLGMKCVTYLAQIMPSFLNVIRTCDPSFREFVLQQLGVLISIVKQHIRSYLDEIFGLIKEYWILNSPMQTTIILLVEQIVTALGGEFKIYLPQIIPQILKVFMHDSSSQRSVTTKLLNALQMFGSSLDDYLHLLVPPVVKLFDSSDIPLTVRRCALETLERLSESLDLTDFASRIIHPIIRTLDSCPELRSTAMDTLCSLVFQLGKKYSTFIPTVNKVLSKHRIQCQRYDILICKIVKSPFLLDWENEVLSRRQKAGKGNLADDSATTAAIEAASIKKLTFKADSLQRAWGAARCVSKEDWMEWLRRLSVELLKESPSPALRSCWATAQTYPPLARDLFNVAFVSSWSELHEELQNELVKNLEMALQSQIPEITQTLLNLAEFMEHTEKGALPLNNDLLGEQASRCRAYAKALHYKEEEFHRGPTTETLEALIRSGNWDRMEEYTCMIPQETQEGAFYRAALALHQNHFQQAQACIDAARDVLDTELTARAGESYNRAYGAMVIVQMLSELEEIIQFKLVPERREAIKRTWWNRLQGCQRVVEDWHKILQVRSLVLSPQEDMMSWLKYSSLCRKSGRLALSHKTLVMLLGTDPSKQTDQPLPTTYPQVTFAYMKHMWNENKKEEAFRHLQHFVESTLHQQALQSLSPTDDGQKREELLKLVAKFSVLSYVIISHQVANSLITYAVPAVNGFFKSIALSSGNSLQDTLRLLTLWFDYGHWPEVYEALVDGIKTIQIDTWLQVIPQLIARIDTPRQLVGRLIHQLLTDIGKHHPQALIYPLTVASKSAITARQKAANQILKNMCEHSHQLVQQAVMVSDELIRVAILWHELWHEGLEEASRLYFSEGNVKGMLTALEPLHQMMEKGPQTLKETSFNQAYGRDLMEAQDWCRKYQRSGNVKDLTQAWDLYYLVFRRISKQLPQLTSLELQYVSPKLLMCRDLELAVPGTYEPHLRYVYMWYSLCSAECLKIIDESFSILFQVAMTREKFPEKIPFRLTRMLTNAMEVTGIDGNYRMTCESVMRVLRAHKDSVMAVLEAFVYDPLLNWRLIDSTPKIKRSKGRSDTISDGGEDLLEGVDVNPERPSKKQSEHFLPSVEDENGHKPEALNKKAVAIVNRVRDKLTGRDFASHSNLDVTTQVDLLIKQATSHENLCQCYIGW